MKITGKYDFSRLVVKTFIQRVGILGEGYVRALLYTDTTEKERMKRNEEERKEGICT